MENTKQKVKRIYEQITCTYALSYSTHVNHFHHVDVTKKMTYLD